MQWLASVCVKRPVFATVLILTILVVGIVGYKNLGVDRFPNVDLPIVTVVTTLPGASPQEIETEVSDKIEEAINTISGIDELRSISTEGVSQVIVSFQLDKDINVAAQEVREHVSTVQPDLPEGTKSPVIAKIDPDAAPVLFLALESNRPLREVTEFADHEVRQSLENVTGVGQVTIIGGRARQIQVDLDPARLRGGGPERRRRPARRRRRRTSRRRAARSTPGRSASPSGSAAACRACRRSRRSSSAASRGTRSWCATSARSSTARRRRRPSPASPASRRSCCRSASSRGPTASPSSMR